MKNCSRNQIKNKSDCIDSSKIDFLNQFNSLTSKIEDEAQEFYQYVFKNKQTKQIFKN